MPSLISLQFPPAPTFTDANLPSLSGKVYLITGAGSGVGCELAKLLYGKGATVYIAARSEARCSEGIEKVKAAGGNGRLESMVVDLADLKTIKPAVERFLKKEDRLDVLFNNAGVMMPPVGSKSKDGHDLEIATNCLAPYLLTHLLEDILRRTAASASEFGRVRIVWVSSLLYMDTAYGGMSFDANGVPVILKKPMENYMRTKVGNAWLAAEFAERVGEAGIMSVSVHPGLMRTDLQRSMPWIVRRVMGLVFKPAVYGAFSELYAGLSPELKKENNGSYITAWGRLCDLPVDLSAGLKSTSEGGSGASKKLLAFCERETSRFL
ncbi:hypothetical protein BP6252_03024 [Coleophoma cylindrospora]|uniref:Uncharacterized protein n=1 Tax=Coleophoma cylindrospora TaxID=1849047 RepID=A0A3D8S6J7_9HELO|nr:hypothetical protein BP6252_03024 [Coleophoma cylindrospora]